MKMTVILVINGAHGMVPKGLIKKVEELEIGGRAETTQTKALLRSARILWRRTWVKDHQLGLMWEARKKYHNNNCRKERLITSANYCNINRNDGKTNRKTISKKKTKIGRIKRKHTSSENQGYCKWDNLDIGKKEIREMRKWIVFNNSWK